MNKATINDGEGTLQVLICDNDEERTKQVRPFLNRGLTVRYDDGTERWIETTTRIDTTPGLDEVERYTWHADGNRVLHDRVLVVKQQDGTQVRTQLAPVWRVWA